MAKPVVFIDSGVGGLPYCKDFLEKNPREEVCFLADRLHFPLGPRDRNEISDIMISLTENILKKLDPKIIVLACNTATVSALEPLRRRYPGFLFVGTVPAVKPAVYASKTGIIGVLGTERTIEDPFLRQIADDTGVKCNIFAIAAPDLVEFIENRFHEADEKEKKEITRKYVNIFRAERADTLVLGCTHFLHLLDVFRREASPSIAVFESLDGITKRIEFLLDGNGGELRSQNESVPVHRLIITGDKPPDPHWVFHARVLGFKLCLFNEI